VAYGITSLPPTAADPARLLALNRAHWAIENRLHWVRDVTFDEDRCRVRKGAGAHVMASLRNVAISLLRLAGAANIAQALRRCAWNRSHALRLIGLAVA
jgi:Transposase DDE domain